MLEREIRQLKSIDSKAPYKNRVLVDQITEYVEAMMEEPIPLIPFHGYKQYISCGSRKESEAAYFHIRKRLVAVGLYLQWNPSDQAIELMNELLWAVSNEFTWCLAAHISYDSSSFHDKTEQNIDLFAAETAETLCELCVLHENKIHPFIKNHVIKRVRERVLIPFLENEWSWEKKGRSNWCSVCAGAIGMSALQIETGERREQILNRVDLAMERYLQSFDEGGATEEGIGYWAYGFGYFIYYIAMRKEMDGSSIVLENYYDKIKRIAEFPYRVQINATKYLPFSDVGSEKELPTGLLSYLEGEFGVEIPICENITPFDFDHCYRFVHISRNLWWTKESIDQQKIKDITTYYRDTQWLVQRKNDCFFAVKAGHNQEEHNHNDVGNFVFFIEGKTILADLGAGIYTADYFGDHRYQYANTRSYWHSVPLVDGEEQKATSNRSTVIDVISNQDMVGMVLEFSQSYLLTPLQNLTRNICFHSILNSIEVKDTFYSQEEIDFEESFITTSEPKEENVGLIKLRVDTVTMELHYDADLLRSNIQEIDIEDSSGLYHRYYRIGLSCKKKLCSAELTFLWKRA